MYNGIQGGQSTWLQPTSSPQRTAPAPFFQPAAPIPFYQPTNPPPNNAWQTIPTQAPQQRALPSWRDDWRANDPNYSFSMEGGWSYTGAGDAQRAQAAAAADALAEQRRQDDISRALYDQQIGQANAAIGRFPEQFGVGKANYEGQYNTALNALMQGQTRGKQAYDTAAAQALEDYNFGKTQARNTYDTTKLQTGQDFVGAKNRIGATAGGALNSLRRLLGSRGAGGGSAYSIAAPQATARQASLQRSDVGQQFGRNQQVLDTSFNNANQLFDLSYGRNKNALDTNWQNYQSDYQKSQTDIGNQRDVNINSLQAQINLDKANLLQKLAGLTSQRWAISGLTPEQAVASGQPFLNEANTLASEANRLGRLPPSHIVGSPPSYAPPALSPISPYTAPPLESYISRPGATPSFNDVPPETDYFSPYLGALLGKRQTRFA